jgi:hypothetical protein
MVIREILVPGRHDQRHTRPGSKAGRSSPADGRHNL